MFILGLTGSIGMGKSTVAHMLHQLGVPVYEADAAIHHIYATNKSLPREIKLLCPAAVNGTNIDRKILGTWAFASKKNIKQLEKILHPKIKKLEYTFLRQAAKSGAPVAVLDIPLLYEIKAERYMDAVLVISAPAAIQKKRVLARPGMTLQKFKQILAKQVPDKIKRARADYVLNTGTTHAVTRRQLKQILAGLPDLGQKSVWQSGLYKRRRLQAQ